MNKRLRIDVLTDISLTLLDNVKFIRIASGVIYNDFAVTQHNLNKFNFALV